LNQVGYNLLLLNDNDLLLTIYLFIPNPKYLPQFLIKIPIIILICFYNIVEEDKPYQAKAPMQAPN